jgi:hypothetical protein
MFGIGAVSNLHRGGIVDKEVVKYSRQRVVIVGRNSGLPSFINWYPTFV